MAVMVGEPPDRPVRLRVVDFAEVTKMLVSDRYDGLPGPDGSPRKPGPAPDTAGERWRKVDLDALRKKQGDCLPAG